MVPWPGVHKNKVIKPGCPKAARLQSDSKVLQTMLGELDDFEQCHIVSSSSASSSVCPKVEPPVNDAPTVDAEHGLVETSDNMPSSPVMADDVLNADDGIEGGTKGIDGIDDDCECEPRKPLSYSKSAKRHRRKRVLQNAHRFAGTEDHLHISISARRKSFEL